METFSTSTRRDQDHGDGASPPLSQELGQRLRRTWRLTEGEAGGLAVRLICKVGRVHSAAQRGSGEFQMVITRATVFGPPARR
jgi:hypothetical protein